ncbi:MAG: hypothetical protein IT173_08220 [Acidobacteria bacterium]|nr:hypothetical protein [Acidobacteriota bacterium]
MSKIHNGNGKNSGALGTHSQTPWNWLFELEPSARTSPKTLDEVAVDRQLKFALKHAFSNTGAPQYLIDSIREKIREV